MKRSKTLVRLVYTGLFSAIILLGTFIFKIPTGIGYIHLGDGFVYIASVILPLPYAMAAAAIGGGLADLLSGYAAWMPATALIKALSVLLFSSKSQKALCSRNYVAVAFGSVINIFGYYLYGSLIQGNLFACIAEIPLNFFQEIAACVLFAGIALYFDLNQSTRKFILKQLGIAVNIKGSPQ